MGGRGHLGKLLFSWHKGQGRLAHTPIPSPSPILAGCQAWSGAPTLRAGGRRLHARGRGEEGCSGRGPTAARGHCAGPDCPPLAACHGRKSKAIQSSAQWGSHSTRQSSVLTSVCRVPDPELGPSTPCFLSPHSLPATVTYWPHLIDEETEAQRGPLATLQVASARVGVCTHRLTPVLRGPPHTGTLMVSSHHGHGMHCPNPGWQPVSYMGGGRSVPGPRRPPLELGS